MPYKSSLARRKRYRQRRKVDLEWVRRYRAYQRRYQRKWRRKHLSRHRDYMRRYSQAWRAKHPIKFRKSARAWRQRNPEKVRLHNRTWYRLSGKTWYRKNRAKRRLQAQRYYRNERRLNLEQQRLCRRRYHRKYRDRINSARRANRARNVTLFKQLDRERYLKNRLKRIVQQRNTQARRARAPGEISPGEWRRLLRAHKFRCFYCGIKLFPANRSLDHKTPVSRGGSNTIDNVVPACRPCNNRKLRMTTEELLARKNQMRKSQ